MIMASGNSLSFAPDQITKQKYNLDYYQFKGGFQMEEGYQVEVVAMPQGRSVTDRTTEPEYFFNCC